MLDEGDSQEDPKKLPRHDSCQVTCEQRVLEPNVYCRREAEQGDIDLPNTSTRQRW